jgi:hypothetical protein
MTCYLYSEELGRFRRAHMWLIEIELDLETKLDDVLEVMQLKSPSVLKIRNLNVIRNK